MLLNIRRYILFSQKMKFPFRFFSNCFVCFSKMMPLICTTSDKEPLGPTMCGTLTYIRFLYRPCVACARVRLRTSSRRVCARQPATTCATSHAAHLPPPKIERGEQHQVINIRNCRCRCERLLLAPSSRSQPPLLQSSPIQPTIIVNRRRRLRLRSRQCERSPSLQLKENTIKTQTKNELLICVAL